MTPDERKRALIALVTSVTAQRLASQARRHSSCVAPALGPVSLAKRLCAERLPDEPELSVFAERLVDWALGLRPGAPRPFADGDLEVPG